MSDSASHFVLAELSNCEQFPDGRDNWCVGGTPKCHGCLGDGSRIVRPTNFFEVELRKSLTAILVLCSDDQLLLAEQIVAAERNRRRISNAAMGR